MSKSYDVVIIGCGISGSALFYELCAFSDIKSILIIEKYDKIASLNSGTNANSQTLHFGDIETNYSIEKAKIVKKTARMLQLYSKIYDYEDKKIFKYPKMLLGVGDEQVEYVHKRWESFRDLFPYMEYWDKDKLGTIEPKVVQDRKENVCAMGSSESYCAINYEEIASSFVYNGMDINENAKLKLNCEVKSITKKNDFFEIKTNDGYISASFVMVNSGAHSLVMAHRMGYGNEYSSIPMAGNYYYLNTPMISSKIYTVQNESIPFAAIHADPDIGHDDRTIRLGPTALPLLKLERRTNNNKFSEFLESLNFDFDLVSIVANSLKDKSIRDFIIKNLMYEIPYFGKYRFLKQAKLIIPSLKSTDIRYAKNIGGLRTQIIDKKNKNIPLGEIRIDKDDGIIFNMTPSPGATSCLGNGIKDVEKICNYLGKNFFKDKFNDLLVD